MKNDDHEYKDAISLIESWKDYRIGDLVSLTDTYPLEDHDEPQVWQSGSVGIIVSIRSIQGSNHLHYEFDVITNNNEKWVIDPTIDIKEKL